MYQTLSHSFVFYLILGDFKQEEANGVYLRGRKIVKDQLTGFECKSVNLNIDRNEDVTVKAFLNN